MGPRAQKAEGQSDSVSDRHFVGHRFIDHHTGPVHSPLSRVAMGVKTAEEMAGCWGEYLGDAETQSHK